MNSIPSPSLRNPLPLAVVAAGLSGIVSALLLNPVMNFMETLSLDDLFELLSSFSISAGVPFGLAGGALLVLAMGQRTALTLGFFLTSVFGIAAAAYAAMLSFDNSSESFLVPYLVGSPLGALIMAIPLAFLAKMERPWRFIGLSTALPTLWAAGVALVFDANAALEVPGLAALYIGWQVIFLSLFVTALPKGQTTP